MQATPATALLDVIRADQLTQHARRMAVLDDPATQARIALAEDLASQLDAAGFAPHHQQIFHTDHWRDYSDVIWILHAYIRDGHRLEGMKAMLEIMQQRGGVLGAKDKYSEAGSCISITIHDDMLRGWTPAFTDQAA